MASISMTHIGIKQARQELPDLVDRAGAGEEIVITRQGKPVAKITAISCSPKSLPSLARFRQSLGNNGTPAADLLRSERDGR
ncbi:MAG TPA: type II toxin-antitoxin system prevent-host-death family antitoxin [Steroidobacteraceae bacterium]|nr:type II toxin-antitoxin system prevent-host-death family antitoxin [Steroidobacteraceae bacterium]